MVEENLAPQKKVKGQQAKKIDCDRMLVNVRWKGRWKTQPILWTERPTGAVMEASSLWPNVKTVDYHELVTKFVLVKQWGVQCASKECAVKIFSNLIPYLSHILCPKVWACIVYRWTKGQPFSNQCVVGT